MWKLNLSENLVSDNLISGEKKKGKKRGKETMI